MPNSQPTTLLWHDYETFGIDPARDRPVQFAAIRTNEALEEIEAPIELWCRPPNDYLPQPDACMVTGISPFDALERGEAEADFIRQINDQLARPNTCTVGYNSIRFDDEVTRHTLYRNLRDPYAREWQGGNSRWDILDLLRACRALRPEGIQWTDDENGKPSFRLEKLTAANGIAHTDAHDAVADVRATIAMARLIKQAQPKLYDYAWKLRRKDAARDQLNLESYLPVLHVSGMYPAERLCTAMVMPIAEHPTNKNSVLVYDLGVSPELFLQLDEAQLAERLFTPQKTLGEDVARLPVKQVHINKCPMLAPMGTLSEAAKQGTQIDPDIGQQHREIILRNPQFRSRIRAAFSNREFDAITNPDLMLYSGGFISRNDRTQLEELLAMPSAELGDYNFPFEDKRLTEMVFRYRARNWPETLSEEEQQQWDEHREQALMADNDDRSLNMDAYFDRIEALREQGGDESRMQLLQSLEDYGHHLLNS